MLRKIAFLTILCGCFAVPAIGTQSVRLITRTYGPKTDIRISKPSLVWEAWPEGEDAVTKVNVQIDGKKVASKYDQKLRKIKLDLTETLREGSHRVEMEVVVNNWAKFKKEWSFRVLPDALSELPEPSAGARKVIEEANKVRRESGLEPYSIDARLCMSSLQHAEYMAENHDAGHNQEPGRQKFTGETPGDRMEQYGFSDSSWEILAPGIDELEVGIERLFAAPYHRLSLLQPGSVLAGGCFLNGNLVIDGQVSNESRIVVSPSDGQRDIPILWKDKESPNPMRFHKAGGKPTGYPIVLANFTPDAKKVILISAVLKDAKGEVVPVFINSPQNDEHLVNAVFVLSKTALEPNEKYSVSIEAKDTDGKNISKKWSFTTADN